MIAQVIFRSDNNSDNDPSGRTVARQFQPDFGNNRTDVLCLDFGPVEFEIESFTATILVISWLVLF